MIGFGQTKIRANKYKIRKIRIVDLKPITRFDEPMPFYLKIFLPLHWFIIIWISLLEILFIRKPNQSD